MPYIKMEITDDNCILEIKDIEVESTEEARFMQKLLDELDKKNNISLQFGRLLVNTVISILVAHPKMAEIAVQRMKEKIQERS